MSIWGAISGAISGAVIGLAYGPWGAVIGAVVGAIVGGFLPVLLAPDVPQIGAPDLQRLAYTSNEIGTPIPDLLGTSKFTGTLLYFGGERNVAETQEVGGGKGGGGGQTVTTGYKYYMSWAVGLCVGPVDELYTVFKGDDVVWSGNLTRPESGGQETIVIPDMGSVTFFFGTADQTASFYLRQGPALLPIWAYNPILAAMVMQFPNPSFTEPVDYKMNSRNMCWAFFADCYIGNYNRMPTMRFVMRKTPEIAFSEHHVIQTFDYNPAHAVYYILNKMVGLPEEWLDEDDFAAVAATLKGESRGVSINLSTFQSALDYIATINAHVDMVLRYGADGKWHPKLIRNDYTPALLPSIDESTILDDPSFSRKSWIDTINEIKVQYSEITIPRAGLWTVNGVPWTGEVVTVGSGKDYATIYAALEGTQTRDEGHNIIAEADVLILVDPGSYPQGLTCTVVCSLGARRVCIKGMGALWSDTVIAGQIQVPEHPNLLVEWVTCKPSSKVDVIDFYALSEAPGPEMFFNRCRIEAADDTDDDYLSFPFNTGQAGIGRQNSDLTLRNCFVKSTSYDVYTRGTSDWIYDISTWKFEAVVHYPFYIIQNYWEMGHKYGTLAEDDTVHVHAEGDVVNYGPAYGEFLITQASLGTGADIKQSTADPAAVDVGNRAIQNRVVSKTIQTGLFTTNANAVWAGSNNLRKESYPYAVISFPANRKAFRLEVGDCFKFSYTRYGVSEMICRVIQITEEGPESESITVHAMEDIFAVSTAITEYYDPTSHAVGAPDYTVSPFTNERIIEAPYVLTGESIALIPLAGRKGNYDLGYNVYMSIDGGDSYTNITNITGFAVYGELVAEYPEDANTIDTDTGMTVEIPQDAFLIETTVFSQILSGTRNMAIIGDEIINFQSIDPVEGEDDQYTLSTIIRGRYDTQKSTHAVETGMYIFSSGLPPLVTHPSLVTGAVRKFKFVPYNIKQSGVIADCTPIDITVEGRALTPYVPGNLEANGSRSAARYDDNIVLTWSPRYRGKGAGLGIPGAVLPETDREGLFKIEIYVSGLLVRTTSAVDAATWTYTEAMNIADNGATAETVVFNVSNYRVDGGSTYESDQATVTCIKN